MTVQQQQPVPPPMPDPQRQAILQAEVQRRVALSKGTVETVGPFQVVLVVGRPVNHILHLLLTVFTAGLWGIVWLCVALMSGQSRTALSVDPWGRIVQN